MDLGVRPMTFNANPDGSTKWIFAQLTGFNGFAVVDFATRKEIKRIKNPDLPPGKATVPEGSDPSHGMAVTADGKTLVVCSRLNNYLYSYSLPDLKLLGGAELGGKGAGWVTLTPDGKTAYVANPVTNDVSVVDVKSMKEVAAHSGRVRAEAQHHRRAAVGVNQRRVRRPRSFLTQRPQGSQRLNSCGAVTKPDRRGAALRAAGTARRKPDHECLSAGERAFVSPALASIAVAGPHGPPPRRLRDLRVLRGSVLKPSPRSLPPTIGR